MMSNKIDEKASTFEALAEKEDTFEVLDEEETFEDLSEEKPLNNKIDIDDSCIPDIIESQINDILQCEKFSKEEELELFKEYKKTENKDILNRIFLSNRGLVFRIAKLYSGIIKECPSISMEDLVSEGYIGLYTAIQKFDPEKEVCLSTYADYWIRQGIQRFVYNSKDQIRYPVHVQEKWIAIKKAVLDARPESKKDDLISDEEIEKFGKEMGLTDLLIDNIKWMYKHKNIPSLNLRVSADGQDTDAELIDFVADSRSIEDEVIRNNMKKEILDLLDKKLSRKEIDIVKEYFGIDNDKKNFRAMASERGVTHQAVNQKLGSILRKLGRDKDFKAIYEDYKDLIY